MKKYNESVNIDLNIPRANLYAKYKIGNNIKLFTNDIKLAILTIPSAITIAQFTSNELTENSLYILSGCAAIYGITNLYIHLKEKQKRFTLK